MALVRRERGLRRVRTLAFEPHHALDDEGFDIGVGHRGHGADFDVEEARDAGRVEGVEGGEGREG